MSKYDPDEEVFAEEVANDVAKGINTPYKYEPAGLPALVAPVAPVAQPVGIPAALPVAEPVVATQPVGIPAALPAAPAKPYDYRAAYGQLQNDVAKIDPRTQISADIINQINNASHETDEYGNYINPTMGNMYNPIQTGGMDENGVYTPIKTTGYQRSTQDKIYGYDLNGNLTNVFNKSGGLGDFIKTVAPLALGAIFPGAGLALGESLLGAGAAGAGALGGAAIGGGTAALSGGDVLKGALMGGLGGAGNVGIGDTGVTIGQATTGLNIVKNLESGNILGAITGATNLAGAGNTEIGDTGFTLNELAKDVNLAKAVISGNPQAVIGALTSVATTAANSGNSANIADAVNKQVPADDGTTSVISNQIAEQNNYPTNDVGLAQLVESFSKPQDLSNNPAVQVASSDNASALAALEDAKTAAKIDSGQTVDLGEVSNKPQEEVLPAGLNFPGDQSVPTQEQQQQAVDDLHAALTETQQPETPAELVNAEEASPEVTPEVQALIDEAVTGQQESAQTQQPAISQQTQNLLNELSGGTDTGVTPEEITPKAVEPAATETVEQTLTPDIIAELQDAGLTNEEIGIPTPESAPEELQTNLPAELPASVEDIFNGGQSELTADDLTDILTGGQGEDTPANDEDTLTGLGDDEGFTGGEETLTGGQDEITADELTDILTGGQGENEWDNATNEDDLLPAELPVPETVDEQAEWDTPVAPTELQDFINNLPQEQAEWDTPVAPEDLNTALTEIASPDQTETTSPTEENVLDFIKEHPDYENFDEDMLEQIKDVTPPEEDIPEMVVTDKKEPPNYENFDEDMLKQIEDPIPYEDEEDKQSVTPKLPVTPKTPVTPKPPVNPKTPAPKTPAVNTDALKTLLAALLANQQQQYLPGIGDVAHIKSDESLFGAIPGISPEQKTETQYDPVAELLAQGDEEYASGGHVDDFSVEALLQILRS
jgi:hypothetical protein